MASTANTTSPGGAPGLQNIRDVAGLPAGAGRLRAGLLYRSDAPRAGDRPPDLAVWPPRTIVDLRSAGEGAAAHPLDADGARVLHLPMIKDANPLRMAQQPSARLAGLRTVYAAMLRDSAENIVRAVMAISQGPAPVLVHCAAGKDRTGVVIAVTLAAIGAPREAIVGDYRRTEAAMPGVMTRLRQDWSAEGLDEALERLARERPDLLSAPASAIEGVLDTLAEHDGAAGGWLVDRGLAPGALGALTERLVAEDGAIAEAC